MIRNTKSVLMKLLLVFCTSCAKDVPYSIVNLRHSKSAYHLPCPDQDQDSMMHLSHESRLINCLLDRYARVTTLARPVRDSSANVVVEFGVSLIQILDFDEIKQIVTTSMWKNYVWEDQVLRWDPSAFGGVTHIRLPATALWTPDIVLYNKVTAVLPSDSGTILTNMEVEQGNIRPKSADEQIKQHEELVAVYFNGTVKWIPPAIYRSSCAIDMKNFPFDEQTCYFKFGSWTYDQHKVDVKLFESKVMNEIVDLREYIPSSEWDVLNTSATRHIRRYPFFDTDPYPELIFSLTLKRQSTFYIYLLVLPCILLSCLTLVLFWIPPQRPDRTAVGMSLFSSFFILLLILVQSSPPTSASISRLGIHYCVNMVLIAVSTILSVMIINLGQPSNSKPPKWLLKNRLDFIANIFCVKSFIVSDMLSYDDTNENGMYMECLNSSNGSRSPRSFDRKGGLKHAEATARWRTLAAILDRIFFIIYLIAIILSTVFIFPR